MTSVAPATTVKRSAVTRGVTGLFSAALVLVVLQGLWAGMFIAHDSELWVFVHGRGAEAAILTAGVATVLAFWKLRSHRSLWVVGAVFTAILVLISFIGGLITDNGMDSLIPVHVPLAMASLLLGTWLVVTSLRSERV
ncbi:MAG: hypothetical protein KJ548_06105 [Actinobacteria bacterium]|nr:hypothetical protein [Actinomycetota bacterium]MCG2803747.1 hypothetical protein [Cellulomonas sp.]